MEGTGSCREERTPPSRVRRIAVSYERTITEPVMTRFDAIRVIARHLGDQAVVSNIGVPGKELYAARDRPLNFYMLGSYTQASPLGLGLATGTERDIWVIDGDGSILGTGILPVIGPGNRRISRSSVSTTVRLAVPATSSPRHTGIRTSNCSLLQRVSGTR